jgi:hypothetical protein
LCLFVHVQDLDMAINRISEVPLENISGHIFYIGLEGLDACKREFAEMIKTCEPLFYRLG